MTAYGSRLHDRTQGWFERVALWTPLRGLFAHGQGCTTVSRLQSLTGLFLALPDTVVRGREEEQTVLEDAFQPPPDAIRALEDIRDRALATVEVKTGGRPVKYTTLWDSCKVYLSPTRWGGV